MGLPRILWQLAEMVDSRTLVDRLRRKTVGGRPVFPTPIELEAADRIEKLEAELAACRIARDGFIAASDMAHAHVIKFEAALRLISASVDVRDCNDIARKALAETD